MTGSDYGAGFLFLSRYIHENTLFYDLQTADFALQWGMMDISTIIKTLTC